MSTTPSKAIIRFAGSDFFIGTSPSGHAIPIETSHERSNAASPMELLLVALGGCTGVDVIEILRKKRQRVTSYYLEVSGERRDEYPRSYTRIFVNHVVTGFAIDRQALARAIELSDTKYCSVAASLRPTAEIISSFTIVEATPGEELLS